MKCVIRCAAVLDWSSTLSEEFGIQNAGGVSIPDKTAEGLQTNPGTGEIHKSIIFAPRLQ